MKKKLIFVFSFLVFGGLIYSLVTAQTIIPSTSNANTVISNVSADAPLRFCNSFSRNLRMGMRSGDVTTLQDKLREHGYFDHYSTGYFGSVTFNAVRAFQKDNGIITTGYFGPLTRASINSKACYTPPVPPIVIDPGTNEAPKNCKVWYDGCNTCHRGTLGGPLACTKMMCIQGGDEAWFAAHKPRCIEYFTDSTVSKPVIHSISGPTNLKVGEVGKWSISASVSDNSYLTYEIVWGDEGVYKILYETNSYASSFAQGSTFEHTYTNAGVYTVVVKVKSSNGQTTETTQTVKVENPIPNEAPYNCKSWFDGCNSCGRSISGGPMYCTMMYCPTNIGNPYCKEYFQ
ncbi:hypothetical protein SDC9_07820 [bioreactor metagenome]|uniref:Uncharacterized protein n=1 Tax=bioreactor metagenome TaxID=1076179 RepID=A0A644T5K6_9ZZZZ|nr:peptidoglycan-binding protein [Candidatus Elulimicrobiales bacterium]